MNNTIKLWASNMYWSMTWTLHDYYSDTKTSREKFTQFYGGICQIIMSDLYVDSSVIYVDLSVNYVD